MAGSSAAALVQAMTERLRGRAGVAQRERRLHDEPLCRHCKSAGIVRVATIVDHVVPLDKGGDDSDDNVQSLCFDCHRIKTTQEDHFLGAANHPDWLEPSAVPLFIISGPPCSGKSTYVEAHRNPGDTVIDLDGIMTAIEPRYRHWAGYLDRMLLNRAIRTRNALLGNLKRQPFGRAWFIVSAPSQAERQWWQGKLGGQVILLHPGVAECKRRAIARGTPLAVQGVDDWERSSRLHWEPRQAKRARAATGLDGWPIE
jgi:hypothetical protein